MTTLFSCAYVGIKLRKEFRSFICAEAATYLLFDLGVTQVSFCQVVIKGHTKIADE